MSVLFEVISEARRTVRAALAAGVGVLLLLSVAPGAASPASLGAPYTFSFKDADLADAAEAILGRALNLTYSIDPDLTAKVTFRIDRRLTPSELLEAFEATLALQDIAVVKNGQTLVLEKRAKAKASSTIRPLEEGRHAIGYQTLVVPLTYAAPGEVAKALQSVGAGGVISYVDDAHNEIVVAGTAQEVEAAVQTIHLFDRSATGGAKIGWFPLERASAPAIAEELSQLLRASRIDGATVVPMKRLNGLYVFARTNAELDEVKKWVTKLDVASEDKSDTLWIYRPHNASADSLKTALSSVMGMTGADGAANAAPDRRSTDLAKAPDPAMAPDRAPSDAQGPSVVLLADGVRLGVDKDTNALLVSASAAQWLQIQKLLNELDRTPGEILIEASIVEVTLTKDDQFGVEFSVLGSNKRLDIVNTADGGGAVGPSFPGFSISYAGSNIKAAIQALGSNSRVEVVSAPKIMTLDGKTATLSVGDQVPVVTQSAQSTVTAAAPLVNTVDYRNTGVILKVTPRITGNDTVLLDISQEVSSVSATTSSSINSPTISERHLESSMMLSDGAVVALGGMISSSRSKGDTGIPILMNLPGVGPLFRTSTNDTSRTELVVLLTAKIIHDRPGADKAMSDLFADMQDLKAHGLLHP